MGFSTAVFIHSKQFHGPAVLVGRGNRGGRQLEVIREKLKSTLLLVIVESHQPQLVWTFVPSALAGETKDLIFDNRAALIFRDRKVLYHPVYGVVFQTLQ